MFTLSNNGVQGTEIQSKFTFLSLKRENPFMQTLFPPPSMVLFHFLDHTSTKPRDTKFSYFLLQFALLLFTWLHFKMRNLLPLVMFVMHKSPFMTSLAAHFPSSLSLVNTQTKKDLWGSNSSRHAQWCHCLPVFYFQVLPEARISFKLQNAGCFPTASWDQSLNWNLVTSLKPGAGK